MAGRSAQPTSVCSSSASRAPGTSAVRSAAWALNSAAAVSQVSGRFQGFTVSTGTAASAATNSARRSASSASSWSTMACASRPASRRLGACQGSAPAPHSRSTS